MATKSELISGMGIAMSLIQGLVEAVKNAGGSDEDLHRLVTEDGKLTLVKVAEFIAKAVRQTFKVCVDYTCNLGQMIADGNYDWVDSDITQEYFPVQGQGKQEREIVLFHFNRVVNSDEAIKEMAQADCSPAAIEELLALGKAHPDLQRQFSIIALKSVWRNPDGYRYVPYLGRSGTERNLYLTYCDYDWDEDCRFAAVRNA